MSPMNHYQQGFTLLELVLVMFIIALIASTPLLFIDEQDQQLRYEETKDKIHRIKQSLLQQQIYNQIPIYSGFLIDNGVLPPNTTVNLDFLTNRENWVNSESWLSKSLVSTFFQTSSKDGKLSQFLIRKGHAGSYVNEYLDSDGDIKDSWGNDFDVTVSSSEGEAASFAVSSIPPVPHILL